jgi:tRNA pseudouridine38/39 synthase
LDNTKSWTRSILSTSIEQSDQNPGIFFARIKGSAFLWHQIRFIMSILFHVGRGLEQPSIVTSLLDVHTVRGRPEFTMASDVPLVLYQCDFGENDVHWQCGAGREGVPNEFALYHQLHQLYENLALRTAMVYDMMKEMERPGYDDQRRNHVIPAAKYTPLLERPRLASVEERGEKIKKN